MDEQEIRMDEEELQEFSLEDIIKEFSDLPEEQPQEAEEVAATEEPAEEPTEEETNFFHSGRTQRPRPEKVGGAGGLVATRRV